MIAITVIKSYRIETFVESIYVFRNTVFVCPHINQGKKKYLRKHSVIRYSSAPISTRVKSAIDRTSQVTNRPHAPTTHAHCQNLFRTHFRTHVARAEVRFYAHVRRNPTSAKYPAFLQIDEFFR